MGLAENIAAVRSDLATHAQNFFICYFVKYPNIVKEFFPTLHGLSSEQLRASPTFVSHTSKVVTKLLVVAERAGDSGQLGKDAGYLVKLPVHKQLKLAHYQDLLAVLVPFLQDTLGETCATEDWQALGAGLLEALKNAGLQ